MSVSRDLSQPTTSVKSGHTPGPWQRSGVREKWRTSYSDRVLDSHTVGPDDKRGWVALIPYDPRNHAEDLANARLIASAPDLLAALAGLYREVNAFGFGGDNQEISEAMAAALGAILKAEGL